MSVEVKRQGKLSANLATYRKNLGIRVECGCRAIATVLYVESQKNVPVDTRALKDSGEIKQIGSGLNATFIVGYARKDFVVTEEMYGIERVRRPPSFYAVSYVHNNPQSTGFEFLRKPIFTQWAEMIEALNSEVKR